MTFDQIESFIAAVESDTFFDAAESLHTTQSTLSKQIKKLEKELGVALWDRSRRRAELTPAGQIFYAEAKKLLNQYHDALQKMALYRKAETPAFRIGTLPFLAQYHLTEPIRQFIQQHPEVSLTLSEVEEQDLMQGFQEDTFDLIIVRERMVDPDLCHFDVIAEDTLSVILPKAHPFAQRSVLSLHDLAFERFLLMHPYTSIYQLCQELFQNSGISPQILRTARVESIISAIQIGEGISLFPESNLRLFQHEGITAVPLAEAPKLKIGIAYKKNREFLPVLKNFFLSFNLLSSPGNIQ